MTIAALSGGLTVTERAVRAIARAGEVIKLDEPDAGEQLQSADNEQLLSRLTVALASLQSALPAVTAPVSQVNATALAAILVEVMEARDDMLAHQRQRRRDALEGVQRALGKLRGLPTTAAVMDAGVRELCRYCGFSRALLFRIEDSHLVLDGMHVAEGKELEGNIRHIATLQLPQLDHLLIETDMFRRRVAILVDDPQGDERTHKPLVNATRTQSYVAAPVQPQGTVIGFLHADRYGQERRVDEVDRDVLWAFAEGFGFALERAALRERLGQQRQEIDRLMRATTAVLDEVYAAQVGMDRSGVESDTVARYAAGLVGAPESRLDALLTRRELEVVQLMAEGATNAIIAQRLVISESTVKSHVKHIMRKLRAGNRAEAVSRYHRISQPGARGL